MLNDTSQGFINAVFLVSTLAFKILGSIYSKISKVYFDKELFIFCAVDLSKT